MVPVPSFEAESSQKRRDVTGPAHYQPNDISSDESSWDMEFDDSDLENKSKGGKKRKADTVQKTWDLRPRNAAGRCITQAKMESQLLKGKSQVQPSRSRKTTAKKDAVKMEKPKKFSVALSQEEIAEDIFKMTGSKLSSKPAKRDKKVQQIVDNLSPGFWLHTITPRSYNRRG